MRLAQPTIRAVVTWNWFCAGLFFLLAAILYGAELYVVLGQDSLAQASLSLAERIRSSTDIDTLRTFALSCVEISDPVKREGLSKWLPSQFTGLIFGAAFFFSQSAIWTVKASKNREISDVS